MNGSNQVQQPQEETNLPIPTPSPAPSSEKPNNTAKIVISIFLLLFIPVIGLIAMWFIAPWNRKAKWIVTIIYIFLSLLLSIALPSYFVFYGIKTPLSKETPSSFGPGLVEQRMQARDSLRKNNLENLKDALKILKEDKKLPISAIPTPVNQLGDELASYYRDSSVGPSGDDYLYQSQDGTDFILFAKLENLNDSEIKTTGTSKYPLPSGYNYYLIGP